MKKYLKEKLGELWPYLLALGALYYGLPLFIRDTGWAMLVMLAAIPLGTFGAGVVYGSRRGFGLGLGLWAALLFIPGIFIFYNASAWVYCPAYGGLALAGTALGRVFYGRR